MIKRQKYPDMKPSDRTFFAVVGIMTVILAIIIILLIARQVFGNVVTKTVTIDLSMQNLSCFENGKRIDLFKISSGNKHHPDDGEDHSTPKGVFYIHDKKIDEYSGELKCPLPYCCWIIEYNIGIHAGYLPGYPASHGCIRLDLENAVKLYSWAPIGTKVTIYQGGK